MKLVRGIAALQSDVTVISNVGDNIWLHGLYVCPDIDTIVYGLAEILDEQRGWGIKGDSYDCLDALRRLGASTWFALGDRDIAMHLLRTSMMKEGKPLSEITELIRKRYSIPGRIIPATDQEIQTTVLTDRGDMHLQEFWVKNAGRPRVKGLRFNGAESANANPEAIESVRRSSLVLVAPANPISSIGPIVAIRNLREALSRNRDRVVAVSPLIGDRAISGPAVKYMKALGLETSAVGVAKYYRDFVETLVISQSDQRMVKAIQSVGMHAHKADITMNNREAEIRLARYLLARFSKK